MGRKEITEITSSLACAITPRLFSVPCSHLRALPVLASDALRLHQIRPSHHHTPWRNQELEYGMQHGCSQRADPMDPMP